VLHITGVGRKTYIACGAILMATVVGFYGKPKSRKKLGSRGATWILNVFDTVKKFAYGKPKSRKKLGSRGAT
jgi:3-polyprenyl-4-hydroxybenzoate decarboxylase